MCKRPYLLCTPGDASLVQVVNRHLNGYAISGQNSDIVHSQLSRNMSRYDVLVGKLYLEGRVGQCLYYRTFKFNNVILWQNNPSSAIISVTFTSTYQLLSTSVVITTPSDVRAQVFS